MSRPTATAGTVRTRYTGDPSETDGLRYDVTNLGHYIRPDSDVLVGPDIAPGLAEALERTLED